MEKIRIRRISVFLFLTFLLSWGFDWLIVYFGGLKNYLNTGMSPWGMLVPAFVALVLRIFFFKDSPIYYRVYREKPRWILFAFLILIVIHGVMISIAVFNPGISQIFQGLGTLIFTLWTLLIFYVYGHSGKAAFEHAGLRLGNIKIGQRFAMGIIWGVWHFPVILRGIHTYPPSLLGLFLGVVFFVLWGIIQGYAVIKTGSIWIAAFMHGVVNSVYSFSIT